MILTEFLLGLGSLCLLLAMHPFTTYPLSLIILNRLGRAAPRPIDAPARDWSFSICVCAYNEEAVIEAKVANLLELRRRVPGLEILIYVDAATDRTGDILGKYGDRIKLHISSERRGKTHGMNLLASQATGDLLVFSDANVILDPECLNRFQRYFADPGVGCVSGHLEYTNPDSTVTAASGSLYWRIEESIKRLEGHSGSSMGADGSLFAIRRSLHRPPPEHLIDDMYVSFLILCEGYRVVQATDVYAYEQSASAVRDEYRRKIRIACQAFNVHRYIWPRLRRLDGLNLYKYVSHKFLRWLMIYFLALAVVFFEWALVNSGHHRLAGGLLLTGCIALLAGYLWAVKPFAQVLDVLIALTGTGVGIWHSIRGDLYQTWTPPGSTRVAR